MAQRGAGFRHVALARQEQGRQVAQGTAGKGNQTAVVAVFQGLESDFGLALAAGLQVGGGKQLAQAQVAVLVFDLQQYAGKAVPARVPYVLVANPHVAADDGLDALAPGAGVELDHAEQVGQVGEGQGRHIVLGRPLQGIIDTDDAVGDGVFGVEAKVNKGGGRHGAAFYSRGLPLLESRSRKGKGPRQGASCCIIAPQQPGRPEK